MGHRLPSTVTPLAQHDARGVVVMPGTDRRVGRAAEPCEPYHAEKVSVKVGNSPSIERCAGQAREKSSSAALAADIRA
jgi:hypothetical protein